MENPKWATPRCNFRVLRKVAVEDMEGGEKGTPEYYHQPKVPWILYFTWDGAAVHGNYWSGQFGYPITHGCYGISVGWAKWIYDRSYEGMPVISK